MDNALQQLIDIEQIRQLKYRYFRFLDTKQYDKLAALFSADATMAYDNGRHRFNNPKELFNFLSEAMGMTDALTTHQGHHPEITILDKENATGVWHFEDTVIRTDHKVLVSGAGIYWDEYKKIHGEWYLSYTGYERLWEKIEKMDEENILELRGMWSEEDIKLSNERPKRPGENALFPTRT